jgi:DNA-directed RNA polymerase specialized sigma24 family protein
MRSSTANPCSIASCSRTTDTGLRTRSRGRGLAQTLLQQRQFWTLFQACLDHLPENIGRVFMMREFLDVEIDDICSELTLTANHCSVLLYRRARACARASAKKD